MSRYPRFLFEGAASAQSLSSSTVIADADQVGSAPARDDEDAAPVKVLPTFNIPFEISPTKPYGSMIKSLPAARDELIGLLDAGVVDPPDHFRVDYLLQCLETSYTPIQTTSFFNFATEGSWELLYSNTLTPRASTSLEFTVSQAISSSGAKGNFENTVHWKFLETANHRGCTGDLMVKGSFHLNSQGNMVVQLDEHVLSPVGPVPDNVEELVMTLQRSVPFESFDPDESIQQITYLDTELRIVRISGGGSGGRFSAVKNIFIKKI